MNSQLPRDRNRRFCLGPYHLIVFFAVTLAISCTESEPAPPEEEAAAPAAADAPIGEIVRIDPRVNALIPADATIEKLAEGFIFIEGPVWDRQNARLLFSDVRGNEIYQWTEATGASTFIDPVFEGDRTGKRYPTFARSAQGSFGHPCESCRSDD